MKGFNKRAMMRSHLPTGKIPGSWRMNWNWARRPRFQLEQASTGFQDRDGGDSTARFVAVRVKGDVSGNGIHGTGSSDR